MKRFLRLLPLTALMLAACSQQPERTEPLADMIRSVNRLTLAQMRVSKMATIDDLKLDEAEGPRQTAAAVVDMFKIGDRKAAYRYDTYMTAYIDLSGFSDEDIKLNPDNKTATLRLPAVETRIDGRDAGITEVHYRVTGLRSEIGPEERARLKDRMSERLHEEMDTNPEFERRLTEQARESARRYFTRLFADNGYTVTINFD